MYKIILDFFVEDVKHKVVYVKPHPADRLQDNYMNIKDVTVIPANCVSELLGLLDGINFEVAVTVSSSSLYTIDEFTNSTIQIGKRIIFSYNDIHKYYFSFISLYDFLMLKKCYRFGVMNEDYELVMKLPEATELFSNHEVQWRSWENVGNSLVIVQKMKWKDKQEKILIDKDKFDSDTVCVFLDFNEVLNHAIGDITYLIENSVIFRVDKIDIETDVLLEESDYIFCFCKNPIIRIQLRHFGIQKSLKYEGIILDIKALEKEEEKIKKRYLLEKISV